MTSPYERVDRDGIPKLLLTAEEAASALGVGRTKVYELLKSGSLGSVLIGKSRRIAVAELVRMVADLASSGDTR